MQKQTGSNQVRGQKMQNFNSANKEELEGEEDVIAMEGQETFGRKQSNKVLRPPF